MADGASTRTDGPDEPTGDTTVAASSGVVHVRDEMIGLATPTVGASTSAQFVDPPVPTAGDGQVLGARRERPRRPLSIALLVLSAGALVSVTVGALAAVVVGAIVGDPDTSRVTVVLAQLTVLLPPVALAVALVIMMRSRLRRQLDEPVAAMRDLAASVADGRLDGRTGRSGPTDLDALAEELDAATAHLQVHVRRLRQHAEWGAQSRMIFEALDLADDEESAHRVAEQALAIVDPDRSVELLLAPHGSTELTVVATNPARPAPQCPVDGVSGCVAIRRAQPVVFDSSESINACPYLRGRPYGPCAGACVPVSVAGRPIGVLHTVDRDREPPSDRVVGQLATLATQLGNRLGALRALESSRLEAATDKLTGLPNRRLLESQLASLIERSTPFVAVLADLDEFKRLNDTFGHEIGDRALQLFAQVLRDKVRGNDVIARLGGEEFVLVYPNMSVTTSIEAVERVRDGLTNALAVSSLPEFTCSFGITHSSVGRSADAILRVADAGLLRAKELGRDQVVYADETLAARIFGDDETRR